MIKLSEQDNQKFKKNWEETRECYFLVKVKKARIVTVRKKNGKEYRYTKLLEAAGREGLGCRK